MFLSILTTFRRSTLGTAAKLLLPLVCSFVYPSMAMCQDGQDVKASIVKLTVTQRNPDFFHPWNKLNPSEASGTGFVIEGNRILTNAHVVKNAAQVYVQPDRSDEKYEATVEAISYGLDLAIVRIENVEAMSELKSLPIDDSITPLRSEVNVYGFPMGGEQISITKGIVSRIEYTSIGGMNLGLRAQIDAAINPGNSGGPAISNGKVVGVAFSGIQNANNIGYLIHSTEVVGFLQDIEDGKYNGKPSIWDFFQTVENPTLRNRLKLPKGMGGVMVSEVRDPADNYPLKVGDVVTKIGPHSIDSQGHVKVNELTLSFLYYCPLLTQNGKVPLTVWRDGQEIEVQCPTTDQFRTVLPFLNGGYPRFFILGPLAFEAATADLAYAMMSDNRWSVAMGTRKSPLLSQLQSVPQEPDQELVIVPSIPFTHKSMKGYHPPMLNVVESINGIKIRNLKHLVEVFRDCTDEYLEIVFAERGAEKLVFNRKEIMTSTDGILTDNNIRKQFSDELEEVWNNGKPF
jgi:S1-C subfamily serine protease